MRISGILIALSFFAVGCGKDVSFNKIDDVVPQPPPVDLCQTDCDPDATYVEENFEQKETNSKVDILFVVDNSPSMYEEQKMLGSRFNSFISALSRVDWQIAFTTTDVSNGTYGIKGSFLDLDGANGNKVLRGNAGNAHQIFANTIQRKESNCSFVCPSSDEQGLLASIMAMDKSLTVNAGFFRDDTDLAIIYISDEDELSDGPRDATKPVEVIDTFRQHWGQTKSLSVYGIIIEPGDTNCLREKRDEGTTAYYGTHVSDLSALTGGITGSLCQRDYSQTLEEISNRVRELVDSFELKEAPTGDVLVELDPVQPNISWRIDGNKLIFSRPPVSGTKIRVVYQKP